MKVVIDTDLLNIGQLIHVYAEVKKDLSAHTNVEPKTELIRAFEKKLKGIENELKNLLSIKPETYSQVLEHERIEQALEI